MGTCISKCKPKKTFKQNSIHVHDKLVISQDPIIVSSLIPSMEKTRNKTLSPVLSSDSTTSFSSISCSTNSKFTLDSSIQSSTSSTCSSTALIVKDRSFSNDYLISCMKENPQVVGVNSVNKEKNTAKKIEAKNFQVSSPKKRARASSPSLVRQKSLRKDTNLSCSTQNKALRSPSPSRRFNGMESNRSFITNGASNECFSRRHSVSRGSSVSSRVLKEGFRGSSASPNRDLTTNRNVSMRRKSTLCQQGAKIESVVGDVQEMDVLMEDINNPLIALDCFIFL